MTRFVALSALALFALAALVPACSILYSYPDCVDNDDDHYLPTSCGGLDCDDENPEVNPGATEVCDLAGIDENCNREVNEGFVGVSELYLDCDGDGYGLWTAPLIADGAYLCTTSAPAGLCPDTMADGQWVADGSDCDDADGTVHVNCGCGKVDILMVIDNSNSMIEEQQSLATDVPALLRALSTGDPDADGDQDFVPIDSLHVGVVTTDMGTIIPAPTCTQRLGDDGLLRTAGDPARGCMASYPPFQSIGAADPNLDAIVQDVACVAQAGTSGCGFEQQLESPLKALTPGSSDLRFFLGGPGHGDVHSDFARSDSLLAIVIVSDEEDCSAADPELFSPLSPVYGMTSLNLRCFVHPEALHPLERYLYGFSQLRAMNLSDLVFAQLTGVPPDLEPRYGLDAPPPEYLPILSDPRMQSQIDASSAGLVPSCDVPGRGLAFPPRRMIQVAAGLQELGARTVVGSICQPSYANFGQGLLRAIVAGNNARCGIEP